MACFLVVVVEGVVKNGGPGRMDIVGWWGGGFYVFWSSGKDGMAVGGFLFFCVVAIAIAGIRFDGIWWIAATGVQDTEA